MTTLKAVIGANLGDEGKGRMVDWFASQSLTNCLVVCSNGGAQRGHTVVAGDIEHTFHHFGSGTLAGADTYLAKKFIVNPMIFMEEYNKLKNYGLNFVTFVNINCLCSTPFDMIINQIIEEYRGANRHGSCGVGIWETILRNEATIGDMLQMDDNRLRNYLKGVRDTYFITRLKSKGIDIPLHWRKIYYSDQLINHYIKDFKDMIQIIHFATDSILKSFNNVIFENGQGLLLDQNIKDSKHSTPSNTGSDNIKEIVDNIYGHNEYTMEVCYVTRTYLTRHGAGEISNQFDDTFGSMRNPDETNKWNIHQGHFRYGKLDIDDLIKRTTSDFDKYWRDTNSTMSIAVTHTDQLYSRLPYRVNTKVYLSEGRERDKIVVIPNGRNLHFNE